jgi:uncharacterized membrane protein HdeD (DUF308 family)
MVTTCAAVASSAALSVWAGAGLVARGAARACTATIDETVRMPYLEAFFGIVAAAVGIILIDSPVRSIEMLAVVCGYWLIAIGVLDVVGSPDEQFTATPTDA